jgi:hypothetical protein
MPYLRPSHRFARIVVWTLAFEPPLQLNAKLQIARCRQMYAHEEVVALLAEHEAVCVSFGQRCSSALLGLTVGAER